MSLLEISTKLEDSADLHAGRILLLMDAFSGEDDDGVEGLTKLAKLDFLLRYPVALERMLSFQGHKTTEAEVKAHERGSVESTMIRYRYGPWDPRHRKLVNLLVAKGLATVLTGGRTVIFRTTVAGKDAAAKLRQADEFAAVDARAKVLAKRFDIGGTALMKKVYEVFPEISSLSSGAEIDL